MAGLYDYLQSKGQLSSDEPLKDDWLLPGLIHDADVKLSSVVKRFLKEPKFAAGTRRDEVAMCSNPEGLNLPLEKFIEICLLSMQKIAVDLGL